MDGWAWYADLVFRLVIVALLALGIVKVMNIVEWWAARKQRRAASRVQVLMDPDDDPREWLEAMHKGSVWIDVAPGTTLEWARSRFPDATYRAVRIESD